VSVAPCSYFTGARVGETAKATRQTPLAGVSRSVIGRSTVVGETVSVLPVVVPI